MSNKIVGGEDAALQTGLKLGAGFSSLPRAPGTERKKPSPKL
jgi:hypothetical protein